MSRKKLNDNKVKDLTINAGDAFIIDAAFKSSEGDVFQDYRDILFMVGRCITSNQEVTLGLTERELWELRARVSMMISVGQRTGADLLCRIYTLIVECEYEDIIESLAFDKPIIFLSQEEMENKITELARYDTEVKLARERKNEDYSENNSENNSQNRPDAS